MFNLFADPDIIRLPSIFSILQKPIAYFIAKRRFDIIPLVATPLPILTPLSYFFLSPLPRAPKSSAAYLSIGGGSPIVKYTQAQADLIAAALKQKGYDNTKCYFAMRYWNPYTEETLNQMHRDGVNTVVVVPLYPQYSISTSGSSLKLLQEIFYQQPEKWGPDKVLHTVVPSWYHRSGYVRTMAELIVESILKYNATELAQGLHILYSAHGVPESYIASGDPYKRQIEECVRLISNEIKSICQQDIVLSHFSDLSSPSSSHLLTPGETLDQYIARNVHFHLSFQSRVGPVQWLKPYTESVIATLGDEGVSNLIAVPVSFVSEHIETLEEMDMEYRELALEHGVRHWERTPAVNTDGRFIADMAALVAEALASPVLSLAEATQSLDLLDDERSDYDDATGGGSSSPSSSSSSSSPSPGGGSAGADGKGRSGSRLQLNG